MKIKLLTLLLVFTFVISGCYTQLETIYTEPPQRTVYTQDRPTADRGDRYDDYYYSDDEWAAYEEGYYDGVFDTQLSFRDYNRAANRHRVHIGWSRSFYGYGFSYGYYYDPYWRWAQLYDPYYYAFYGYYAYPYYMRYRHYGFFHSPFWGPRTIVYYNNWHYHSHQPNYAYTTGPRSSGVHRGNTSHTAVNRTRAAASGLDASRTNRSRVDANRSQPAMPRSTVDRNRGTSSRGTVTRTPQRSPSQGNVGRSRTGSSTGQGNVGRSRGSSGSTATPQRSRSGGNETGRTRSRGGGDEISAMQRVPASSAEQTRRPSATTADRTPQNRPDNNVRQRTPDQPRMMPVPAQTQQSRPAQTTRPAQTQQSRPVMQNRPVQSTQPAQSARPAQTARPARQNNTPNVQPPQRTQRQVQAPAPRPANNSSARPANQRNNSQPAVRNNSRSNDNDRNTSRTRRD
jgi:hypothetical protein